MVSSIISSFIAGVLIFNMLFALVFSVPTINKSLEEGGVVLRRGFVDWARYNLHLSQASKDHSVKLGRMRQEADWHKVHGSFLDSSLSKARYYVGKHSTIHGAIAHGKAMRRYIGLHKRSK